ncbi:long-chain fatty acid--CoA ligase [Rhodococcus sp. BP-252]|uniref:Acyl-CoA synthetase n=1 Tax=Rhodococcoides kyotonense TaxID=398843 RepID=A0A177YAT7_9NOCA|nr:MULTISPECIES: long-chain fatty acid--CoA ligase [Rhodococcus]MBY6411562.1 long-chain fatty acid--CoA ligase [Rhodococcus sp. BP-320]MBY6417944.1 long-chain fatty acid--CoA ligase [Rhodococcus sp. BP-321]MBY6422155.1 long-chain fatty acid--CoA ligase [Rhodococcus sp. BP-324]MBY6427742.1 long-chain fatty acid--CoA ligase [Rhodococcus sp. BP-323]MBY6433039.1 long-chain fatty acid--CoA ligase [Rhodococcus sp. BP-322]
MREYSVPASFTIPDDVSMADTVFRYEKESPNLVPFQRLVNGSWVDVTAKQFAQEVAGVAKGLIASGIELGDRVAILSATRYEWVVLDYAIWTAGGCTVAIYETSAPDQAQWILEDSSSKLLVVETPAHAEALKEVTEGAAELREVLQIDAGALDELTTRGVDVSDEDLHARRGQVTASSPATLIYTSGTTGRPKGVQLTHSNFYAETKAVQLALGDAMKEGRRTLMFLPMAHVFARAISFGAFESKTTVGHTSDISTLLDQFALFKPNFILSVPRVFEKVYNSAKQKAHDGGKGKIFDKAAATAIEWSEAKDKGGPGLVLNLKHALFDKLVYSKLRAALGGECDRAVSGGAALGARLGHFFRGVGIPVYEGYGLTETSAAVTVNTTKDQRVGTVGKPINGHAAKIAEDGELLVKGPVVFGGYWHNDKATAESIVDGWFHTGDLGSIDQDGFVSITGRKKEIIVTAGGKNVAPAVLEDALRAHALISQCLVVGDAKPFIGALITLDPEALPGWKERNSIADGIAFDELSKHADLVAEIDKAVADANKKVSKAEQIKKYKILEVDFTVETGELTPTMKLKRNIIHQERGAEIEAIYAK